MSSLLAVLDIGDEGRYGDGKFGLQFGNLLRLAAFIVKGFHRVYDDFQGNVPSSVTYRNNWEHTSETVFQRFFLKNEGVTKENAEYDDAIKSGTSLPGYPQGRPFPFKDKSTCENILNKHGDCVKEFAKILAGIAPGALPFGCTCPHPIMFGFKVLERGESLRAVLDILAFHFAELLELFIYYFACLAFRPGRHTLLWDIKSTTFVSDRSHVDNHTCHRGFHPDSYHGFNGLNTGSHEQCNRPISKFKDSLRNFSQVLYTPLLAYHKTYLNIRVLIRTERDQELDQNRNNITQTSRRNAPPCGERKCSRADILSVEDIQKWYFETLQFNSLCCRSLLLVVIALRTLQIIARCGEKLLTNFLDISRRQVSKLTL